MHAAAYIYKHIQSSAQINISLGGGEGSWREIPCVSARRIVDQGILQQGHEDIGDAHIGPDINGLEMRKLSPKKTINFANILLQETEVRQRIKIICFV